VLRSVRGTGTGAGHPAGRADGAEPTRASRPGYAPSVDIAALVPGAVGIALSPLPVASVVFLLGHRRGYGSAVACAAGWMAAVAVALVVAVSVGEQLPTATDDGPPVQALVALVASVVLFVLAAWQWVRRRLPDGSPASTRWADAMEALGPGRAFGLGALLFVSPKSVVLAFAAGLTLGDADPRAASTVGVGAVFVLASGVVVLLPVVLAVALGPRAERPLEAMRSWIARWGAHALVVVLVVLGVVQLVIGLTGLR
jgi:hypothetical protein